MIYRWQDGAILPDAALDARLGLDQATNIDAWLDQQYPHVPLGMGFDYRCLGVRCRTTDHEESALIDVEAGDHTMLIYCEHWGDMLACYRWLVDLSWRNYRLSVAIEVDDYVDEVLQLEGRDTAWAIAAKGRLIAAGYPAEQVDQLVRRQQARDRETWHRHHAARRNGADPAS